MKRVPKIQEKLKQDVERLKGTGEKLKTAMEKVFRRVPHQSHKFRPVVERMRKIDWGGLIWYWFPLLCYATVIFYLSSLSVPEEKFEVFLKAMNSLIPAEGDIFSQFNDKFYHMTEYALLAVLTYRAFRYSMKDKSEVILGILSVMAVVAFGCSDEFHQWFIPLRHIDGWDLMADSFGGIMGVSVWEGALRIPVIRFLEEWIPLKLQVALNIHVLRI